MTLPSDYQHLLQHAEKLFPVSNISVDYSDDEIIYIDVDGVRLAFEIGSDDDAYVFHNGQQSFSIPLMTPTTDCAVQATTTNDSE